MHTGREEEWRGSGGEEDEAEERERERGGGSNSSKANISNPGVRKSGEVHEERGRTRQVKRVRQSEQKQARTR